MKTWEISHHTSSPHYPQSNGRVENSVKIVNNLMNKATEDHQDPFLVLLDLRNTPSKATQLSPAHIVFGRHTRTLMPISDILLQTPKYKNKSRRSNVILIRVCQGNILIECLADPMFQTG